MREEIESRFTGKEKPEIRGFLLVEYVPHTQELGYELLVGLKDDPAFGPVVTLSKGGDDADSLRVITTPHAILSVPWTSGKPGRW